MAIDCIFLFVDCIIESELSFTEKKKATSKHRSSVTMDRIDEAEETIEDHKSKIDVEKRKKKKKDKRK